MSEKGTEAQNIAKVNDSFSILTIELKQCDFIQYVPLPWDRNTLKIVSILLILLKKRIIDILLLLTLFLRVIHAMNQKVNQIIYLAF